MSKPAQVYAPGAEGVVTTDVLIIGAGPVGLFQVFELGLLELHAEVVDALPHIGGQCAELYPDKPIYDIPGMPVVGALELVRQLEKQAAPFKPGLHLGQRVATLTQESDGRFALSTDRGTRFAAKAVIIAAGSGAFMPRRLKLDGIAPLEGHQVHYQPPAAAALVGQHVVVLGDDDQALNTAAELAEAAQCTSVTLLHRRDQFRATPEALTRMQVQRDAGRLDFVAGQPVALGLTATGNRLTSLQVAASDGQTLNLPADTLLPLLGLNPQLGPIADWGLALARRQLSVNTETFETSEPGIYAVGDINTYPGKKKLLLCGFHEATLAAYGAALRVAPQRAQHLQYTTTSPRLHQLLGVAGSLLQ